MENKVLLYFPAEGTLHTEISWTLFLKHVLSTYATNTAILKLWRAPGDLGRAQAFASNQEAAHTQRITL